MPEVPAWKDNFPISWVDDHFVTRREFTKSLVWVSLATFLANVVLAMLGRLRRLWDAEALPQVAVYHSARPPGGGSQGIPLSRRGRSLLAGTPGRRPLRRLRAKVHTPGLSGELSRR